MQGFPVTFKNSKANINYKKVNLTLVQKQFRHVMYIGKELQRKKNDLYKVVLNKTTNHNFFECHPCQ